MAATEFPPCSTSPLDSATQAHQPSPELGVNSTAPQRAHRIDHALLAAALLLPLAPNPASAETAPDRTTVSYKYLDYVDFQPDAERIRIRANALNVVSPINDEWSFSAGVITDVISGASPSYHTSRLKTMRDFRRAENIGLTRWTSNGSLTLSHVHSAESDYLSRGLSLTALWYTDDSKNTGITAGLGATRDIINPSNQIVVDERKSINDLMVGITQVLGQNDIAQLIARYSSGHGYYSDPYKAFDERPRERDARSLLARWNHHFPDWDSSVRSSYRWYQDSFGIRAHTVSLEYAQTLAEGRWVLTPIARLYSQTAANFYVPVNPEPNGITFPPETATYYSEDQRLSAFGARTIGVKSAHRITRDTWVDVKYEHYAQRANWAVAGQGDKGLAPFNAKSVQVGVTHQF